METTWKVSEGTDLGCTFRHELNSQQSLQHFFPLRPRKEFMRSLRGGCVKAHRDTVRSPGAWTDSLRTAGSHRSSLHKLVCLFFKSKSRASRTFDTYRRINNCQKLLSPPSWLTGPLSLLPPPLDYSATQGHSWIKLSGGLGQTFGLGPLRPPTLTQNKHQESTSRNNECLTTRVWYSQETSW